LEAPAREDVDGRAVLGDADRMVERQKKHRRSDPDLPRPCRNRPRLHERRWRMPIVDEMVLSQPDVVVTDRLRPGDLVGHPGVEVLIGCPPFGRIAERVPQAEAELSSLRRVVVDALHGSNVVRSAPSSATNTASSFAGLLWLAFSLTTWCAPGP